MAGYFEYEIESLLHVTANHLLLIDRRWLGDMQELAKSAHLDVAVEHLVALGTDKVLPGNGGRFCSAYRSYGFST